MKFEYEIKGISLNMDDMCQIDDYYQNAKIAEYLIEAYGIPEEDVMLAACKVKKYMDKYSCSEEAAIIMLGLV